MSPPPPDGGTVTSDDLSPEQLKVLKDYLYALSRQAKAKGQPQEEVMDKAGIRWQAMVDAEGTLRTLVIDQTRRPREQDELPPPPKRPRPHDRRSR